MLDSEGNTGLAFGALGYLEPHDLFNTIKEVVAFKFFVEQSEDQTSVFLNLTMIFSSVPFRGDLLLGSCSKWHVIPTFPANRAPSESCQTRFCFLYHALKH
jgi:hypothetical protein